MRKEAITLLIIAMTGQLALARDAAIVELPATCQSAATRMPASGAMGHTMDMDEAHTAMMAGVDSMKTKMMTGMTNPDIDVAFICGLIPHHQGAIAMAQAELKYGKDEPTRQRAQKIIDARTEEIAEMVKWLAARAR